MRSILLLLVGAAAQSGPVLFLNACGSDANAAAFQRFTYGAAKQNLFTAAGMCLDIADFAKGPNATVYTWPCGQDGAGTNEAWTLGASFIQSRDATPGMCLVAGFPGDAPPGAGTLITTAVCDASAPAQSLAFSASTGRITHGPTGLCVDAGSRVLGFCDVAGHAAWAVCDPAAGLDARAADLVGRLSVADKLAALVTHTPPLPSVGLPAYDWWQEAAHGISRLPGGDRPASNTALPITTSCAFNRTLWKATGNLIGREARAYINAGVSGSTFWVRAAHPPPKAPARALNGAHKHAPNPQRRGRRPP
jgi:hypothetical protein